MTDAVRYDRIEHPFVSIPIRSATGSVELIDVWHEDHFDPDPDGDTIYLVLDFVDVSRLIPTGKPDDIRYAPTGGISIELQAVRRDTGEGVAMPHRRDVSPIIPDDPSTRPVESGTGGRSYSTRPLTGLAHIADSPRRANRN